MILPKGGLPETTKPPIGTEIPTPDRWMTWALLIASVQCLIWGAAIIIAPKASAGWYGFAEPPSDIFLWQGAGLGILLSGVGYALAAPHPTRHWVMVLVGLLAKTFAPIGLVSAALRGDVPWATCRLLPINDVIWWLPFSLIVIRALRGKPQS